MQGQNRLRPRSKAATARNLLPPDDNGANSPRNNHFINKNAKNVRLIQPDCYKKGGLLSIRIWNMLNPENPVDLMNGRTSQYDTAGLEGVSISEPVFVCSYAGVNRKTDRIIGHDEKDCNPVSYIIARSKQHVVEGVDFWEEPYVKFCKVAKDAHQSGRFSQNRKWDPDWNCLLPATMNKAISPWKQQYFIVGSVYNNGPNLDLIREYSSYEKNGKVVEKEVARDGVPLGDAAEDPVPLITVSASAGRKLLELMVRTKEKFQGDPDVDPAVMYKYGDPCGKFDAATRTVKGGVFFHLFNPDTFVPDKTDPVHKQLAGNTTYVFAAKQPDAKSSKLQKGGEQVTLYEAAVTNGIKGPKGLVLRPDLSTEQVNNITSKHLFFWKDSDQDPADSFFLAEPSIEERCIWIANAFKFVPNLVKLCWMSNPEYLAFDAVKAVLNNRTQVVVPDYNPEPEEEDLQPTPVATPSSRSTRQPKTQPVEDVPFEDFDTVADATVSQVSVEDPAGLDAEDLMDSFENEGEIEAELDDLEVGEGGEIVEQFQQVEDFEDEVSSDFDMPSDGESVETDENEVDPFQASVNKSMAAAKAISRSASRGSKPKA